MEHAVIQMTRLPLSMFALVLGLTLTFLSTFMLARQEGEKQHYAFQHEAGAQTDNIPLALNRLVQQLSAMQQLFDALPQLDQASFKRLAEPFLAGDSAVQAFEWAPRVEQADLPKLQQQVRRQDGADFAIWELVEGGRRPVQARDTYFPVRYIVPQAGSDHFVGYDLASESIRRTAMLAAAESRQPVLTPPVFLAQDKARPGYLLLLPINEPGGLRNKNAVRGFVLVVIDPARMLQTTFDDASLRHVKVSLFDRSSAQPGSAIAHFHSPGLTDAMLPAQPRTYQRSFDFAGRQLDIHVDSVEPDQPEFLAAAPLSLILLGTLSTLSVAALIFLLQRRNRQMSLQAVVQSRDLAETHNRAQRIFEAAPTPMMLIDESGAIVEANHAALHFFGYSAAEIATLAVEDLIPAPRRKNHVAHRKAYHSNPESRLMGNGNVFAAINQSGQEVPISVGLSPLKIAGKNLVIATIQDLSAQLDHSRQLQQERDQRQRYLDTMNALLIELDQNGTVKLANLYACMLTGIKEHDLLGKNWFEVALPQPEGMQHDYPVFLATMRGESPQIAYFESNIVSPDGERHLISWINNYLTDEAGKLTGVLISGHDVTERRDVENAILQLQRNQQATLNALPDLLFEFSSEGKYLAVHSQRDELLLQPRESVMGKYIDEVFPEPAMQIIKEAIAEAISKGISDGHLIEVCVAGRQSWFELSCARKDNGDELPVTCLMLSRDVTERVCAQQALKYQQDNLESLLAQRSLEIVSAHSQFKTILSGSPVPILVVDVDGVCTHWNRACEAFFGIAAEEMIGSIDCWRAFYDEPRPILAQLIARRAVGDISDLYLDRQRASPLMEGAYEVESYFPKLDRWLFFTAAPLFNDRGEQIGAMETLQDVTARKRVEEEIEEARRTAEAASHAKSAFLAHMSHEIRTPLNGVIGLAHLGLKENQGRQAAQTFEKIQKSGEHLRNLINDILDFSKIEAGKLILEESVFELGELIDRTVELTALQAYAKGVELIVEEQKNLPATLHGDQLRLCQCLVNLVGNAIKFTEKGWVCFTISRDQNAIRFVISDSGVGMLSTQANQLFDAFSQADSSTTRRFGGSGLGLTITRQLVDMMGGSIEVESSPGKGSRFSITLPLRGDEAAGPQLFLGATEVPPKLLIWGLLPEETRNIAAGLADLGCVADIQTGDYLSLPDSESCLLTSYHRLPQIALYPDLPARILVAIPPGSSVEIPAALRNCAYLWPQPLRLHQLPTVLGSHLNQALADLSPAQRMLGLRVLGVDDNDVNRMVLEGMLRLEGAEVELAPSGPDALGILNTRPADHFHAMITDIQMPEMDGYELAERVRQRYPNLPVIGLTAFATAADRDKCFAVGMVAHLTKPVDGNKLIETLLPFVDQRRSGLLQLELPAVSTEPPPPPASLPPPEPAPQAAPGDLASHVDMDMLMAQFKGRIAFINKLFDAAAKSNQTVPARLREVVASGDFGELRKTAHLVRGMAGNLRANDLHKMAGEVEHLAVAGDSAAFVAGEQLVLQLERLLAALDSHLKSASAS
jgi:PAS domain S-box-containing protein